MKYVSLALSLFCFNAVAAEFYKVETALMGLTRKLEVKVADIQASEVPAEFPANEKIKTDLVLTVKGKVSGESWCFADQLVASYKQESEGQYPDETKIFRIKFVEVAESSKNGLAIDSRMCAGGTHGDFEMKLLTEVNGLGSQEKIKKWKYIFPGGKTVDVQLDVATGKWSHTIN